MTYAGPKFFVGHSLNISGQTLTQQRCMNPRETMAGQHIGKMMRETSRYRLNRFISDTPMAKISYQPDVTTADLQHIQTELEKRASHTSLTIIVIENFTARAIL
jgi:hypothetical protein